MSDRPPPPPAPPSSEPPPYKVYRSRRRLRDRFAPAGQSPIDALRGRRGRRQQAPPGAPERRGITPRRVLKWVAIVVLGWILVAVAVFFINAGAPPGVSDAGKEAA